MAEGALYYIRASGFAILLALSFYIAFAAIYQLFKQLQKGQPDPERKGDWGKRFKETMSGVFGQKKLVRNLGSAHHAIIFYGFIIVTIIAQGVFIRAFFPAFSFAFLGPIYIVLLWLGDIFSIGVILAVGVGFYNRYIHKSKRFEERLEHQGGLNRDATIILIVVAAHVIFALLLESLEIKMGTHPSPSVPPIGNLLAKMWGPHPEVANEIIWWLHAFSVWGFLIYIFGTNVRVPRFYPSKHFHILSAPFSVAFSNQKPRGRLRPMAKSEDEFEMSMMSVFEELPEDTKEVPALDDISDEEFGMVEMVHRKETPFSSTLTYKFQLSDQMIHVDVKKNAQKGFEKAIEERSGGAALIVEEKAFAVSKIEDLRWTDMLDLYSCTGCGRCQELCPAFMNEQPLSPKALILNLRERLLEKATFEFEHPGEEFVPQTPLVGDIVPTETLWSCTTCGACVDACPVYIDHIDKIVDMRRHLSMVEADLPSNVDTVYNNIEVNSNPWGIGKSERDKWAEELNIKRMKDDPDTDVLFWVGCAGSFDDRAKKVATSLVTILRAADIDFAILGKEENCTGDPARRMGNEYLAMQMMTQNVNLLNSYQFKEVITFCPHCFNNLANELPDYGGHYRVTHAVDYVNQLIKDGRISLDTSVPLNITYHDSCYLGRHNGIYTAPREILMNFEGIQFTEMDMNKNKGLCCGAGGGRIWFELPEETKAINKTRVQMAEKTGADKIGVSCPFCTIMLEDGAKNMNSNLEVIDLMEIVATNLK